MSGLGFEQPTFRLQGQRSNSLRHSCGSMVKLTLIDHEYINTAFNELTNSCKYLHIYKHMEIVNDGMQIFPFLHATIITLALVLLMVWGVGGGCPLNVYCLEPCYFLKYFAHVEILHLPMKGYKILIGLDNAPHFYYKQRVLRTYSNPVPQACLSSVCKAVYSAVAMKCGF